MSNKTRVLIADDEPLVREMLILCYNVKEERPVPLRLPGCNLELR